MPCVDHDFQNCPAFAELRMGEHCKVPGCERQKAVLGTPDALFDPDGENLEQPVIAGKTGGLKGTI